MDALKRRDFLKYSHRALAGAVLIPLVGRSGIAQAPEYKPEDGPKGSCWLDVCAPFIVESETAGIHSEIVLTSDTFSGRNGHDDAANATEYEIHLYDAGGKAVGEEGVAKRITVRAMQTTVIPVRNIIGAAKEFTGGMKIRQRPIGRQRMHASDLFSSAFLRLSTAHSFDNVHANPDPLEWQRPDSFFYSMPFPPMKEYECVFGMFNPNDDKSSGSIFLHDSTGRKVREVFYDLKPHTSRFFDLRTGKFVSQVADYFSGTETGEATGSKFVTSDGGTIAATNREGTAKSFGYLVVKRPGRRRFSVDHPIHQSPFAPVKSEEPFDAAGKFKARNILYTPLAFNSKKIGGVTLDTRFHLSSGAPIEEHLWLSPFITDAKGDVAWLAKSDADLPASIARGQISRGAIKLGRQQSCVLDCADITLPKDFSGGLFLGVKLNTNHTLMKVEINVPEWGAHAFTHFRPGLSSARTYQKAPEREGLGTDYITTGARMERNGKQIIRDEIIGVLNIDDRGIEARPELEIFSSKGLVGRLGIGEVPPFACRHLVLSELLNGKQFDGDLTLRLVDAGTTVVMSIIHVDYIRRDIALDHGSDRFSTFHDYDCDPKRS
jgi:hypothetical protein